jgi:hypothetical protein
MSYTEMVVKRMRKATNEREDGENQAINLAAEVVDTVISAAKSTICGTFTAEEIERMVAARWSTLPNPRFWVGEMPVLDISTGATTTHTSCILAELKEAVRYGAMPANKILDETIEVKIASLLLLDFPIRLALSLMVEECKVDLQHHNPLRYEFTGVVHRKPTKG